jgi:hypothetical protein
MELQIARPMPVPSGFVVKNASAGRDIHGIAEEIIGLNDDVADVDADTEAALSG